jgi:hypothetical protein
VGGPQSRSVRGGEEKNPCHCRESKLGRRALNVVTILTELHRTTQTSGHTSVAWAEFEPTPPVFERCKFLPMNFFDSFPIPAHTLWIEVCWVSSGSIKPEAKCVVPIKQGLFVVARSSSTKLGALSHFLGCLLVLRLSKCLRKCSYGCQRTAICSFSVAVLRYRGPLNYMFRKYLARVIRGIKKRQSKAVPVIKHHVMKN